MSAVLVRILAVAASYAIVFGVERLRAGEDVGADIGVGLIWFAVLVVGSAAWGCRDARRRPVGPVVLTWLVVAVVVGVAMPFVGAARGAGFDWAVVRSDLLRVSPFIAGLIAVPATLAALACRSRRSS